MLRNRRVMPWLVGFIAWLGQPTSAGAETLYIYDAAGNMTRSTDTAVDPLHCGGENLACSDKNIVRSCTGGTCTGVCSSNWADCDNDKRANGCEADLYSVNSCGSCTPCSALNIYRSCNGTPPRCDGTCWAEFGDCDNNKQLNGCEASLKTLTNCGACGARCSTANVLTIACTGSPAACVGTCVYRWGDCDGNMRANGCETDLAITPAHCGACGARCSTNHMATVTCSGYTGWSATCGGTCSAGYGDCDGDKRTNGCETSLGMNSQHCGRCGRACGPGVACFDGECAGVSCGGGETFCSGACVDLMTDAGNCGACGRSCSSTRPFCDTGVCVNPDL